MSAANVKRAAGGAMSTNEGAVGQRPSERDTSADVSPASDRHVALSSKPSAIFMRQNNLGIVPAFRLEIVYEYSAQATFECARRRVPGRCRSRARLRSMSTGTSAAIA